MRSPCRRCGTLRKHGDFYQPGKGMHVPACVTCGDPAYFDELEWAEGKGPEVEGWGDQFGQSPLVIKHEEEPELWMRVFRLLRGLGMEWGDCKRPFHVTTLAAAYGKITLLALQVNGSPPQGTLIVDLYAERREPLVWRIHPSWCCRKLAAPKAVVAHRLARELAARIEGTTPRRTP